MIMVVSVQAIEAKNQVKNNMKTIIIFQILLVCVIFLGLYVQNVVSSAVEEPSNDGIPVFVMLPLDTIDDQGHLKNPDQLKKNLQQLHDGGVDGVMSDVWWGLVEKYPRSYDFSAYLQLVELIRNAGLKFVVTMSFHKCGGNVGDACNIDIPSYALSVSNCWYKDQEGNENNEYINLSCDEENVFDGRTPLELYYNFMSNFSSTFAEYIGSTIVEAQVGMGPAGELRYPSYPLKYWNFPGVGEFQCWDSHSLTQLAIAANKTGQPGWASPPSDAGGYNTWPADCDFFKNGYSTNYGRFFLNWYMSRLVDHGRSVLNQAGQAFSSHIGSNFELAVKVAGIHWQYKDPSHAAEATAGYYNTNNEDAYKAISQMLKDSDNSQPNCNCAPEELVEQVIDDTSGIGIGFEGENALPRYDQAAYDQIYKQACYKSQIDGFTYLRLTPDLLSDGNWSTFTSFVSRMHGGC